MASVVFEPLTLAVPLREDPAGVFRVGKSRVLLEIVLRAFQAGATPEDIVRSYDTLALSDVYAVVSYYLAHPAEMEQYLLERDEIAGQIRDAIEGAQPPRSELKDELMIRARAKGLLRDQTR